MTNQILCKVFLRVTNNKSQITLSFQFFDTNLNKINILRNIELDVIF